MDILFQGATEQLKALAARQISARELLQASVDRAERTASILNAVVARDLERAFTAAQRVDDRRALGEPLGRLAGLPMTIKDAFDVRGMPAAVGLPSLLDRPADDAVVVARVRQQDAVVWGKTNTPVNSSDWQAYNDLYGTTNNPWDVKLTPGGSSGGAAAAVAAGLTALEIGSDIGGSLRIPAGFCGVSAHKPTYGLVPQRGQAPFPGFPADIDMLAVGPMARSARDLRLLLSIVAEAPDLADAPSTELNGLRIGLWCEDPAFVVDTEVKSVIDDFAARLSAAGAVVEPIGSPVDTERLMLTYTTLLYPLLTLNDPLSARAMYELLRGPAKIARALGAKPLSTAQAILASSARHHDWLWADEARVKMMRAVEDVFARYDVLITPITPTTAFAHDHRPLPLRKLRCSDGRAIGYTEMLTWNALATVCALPATAVPAGLSPGGLPVGVQVIGPHGGDSRTLAVAQAIDEQIGGFVAPPIG